MMQHNPYQSAAVTTASPQALVTMLYDRAITGVLRARSAIAEGDAETRNHELVRVQDILTELIVTLDHERGGAITPNLHALYAWCREEAIAANVHGDAERLDRIERVLTEIRDAWEAATAGLADAG